MPPAIIHYNDHFAEKWVRDLSPIEWRGKVELEYVEVPLSKLEHAGCWTDPEVVNGWVETLQRRGAIPPPVGVETERGTYYLHDGNHRLEALVQFASEEDACVRLAVARPVRGFRFARRTFEGYSTYVVEAEQRPLDLVGYSVFASVLSAIGLFMTAMVPGAEHSPFFVILLLCVAVSTWLGGWKTGMLASLWSLIGSAYFLLAPNRSLLIDRMEHIVQFVLLGILMTIAVGFMELVRRHPTLSFSVTAFLHRRSGG